MQAEMSPSAQLTLLDEYSDLLRASLAGNLAKFEFTDRYRQPHLTTPAPLFSIGSFIKTLKQSGYSLN